MWIFTPDGFFSVVEHRDDPAYLLVRARDRSDLNCLQMTMGYDAEIIEKPDGDYRWQTVIPRQRFAAYAYAAVEKIDYTTSVKDRLDKGDSFRHGVMLDVWSDLMRLQTARTRYTGFDFADDDDDIEDALWERP